MKNCPVCNSDNNIDFWHNETIKTFKCLNCDVLFQDFLTVKDKLDKMYNQDYYIPWGINIDKISDSAEMVKKKTFNQKLKIISGYCKPGKILDIGCANGFFLELAKENNWDPYGLEINSFAVKLARQKLGDRIIEGDINKLIDKKEYFNVVTLFDVIEHMSAPGLALKKIHEIIKTNGILVIVTPNWRSLSGKLLKSRWMNFKIEHLFYFSKFSLGYLLEKAGFEIIFKRANSKKLNLSYINNQFRIYDKGFFSKIISNIYKIIPSGYRNAVFTVFTGELFVIARKK